MKVTFDHQGLTIEGTKLRRTNIVSVLDMKHALGEPSFVERGSALTEFHWYPEGVRCSAASEKDDSVIVVFEFHTRKERTGESLTFKKFYGPFTFFGVDFLELDHSVHVNDGWVDQLATLGWQPPYFSKSKRKKCTHAFLHEENAMTLDVGALIRELSLETFKLPLEIPGIPSSPPAESMRCVLTRGREQLYFEFHFGANDVDGFGCRYYTNSRTPGPTLFLGRDSIILRPPTQSESVQDSNDFIPDFLFMKNIFEPKRLQVTERGVILHSRDGFKKSELSLTWTKINSLKRDRGVFWDSIHIIGPSGTEPVIMEGLKRSRADQLMKKLEGGIQRMNHEKTQA